MTAKPKGLFITVEGVEGVGKSTNIEFIASYLEARGVQLVQTREPGGTPLAESIRSILLEPRDEKVDDLTELLLVFAARSQHLTSVINPAIVESKWVLCDRFTDATYAYQGGGRGLSIEAIAQLESLVQNDLRPDHTILLDAPLEISMARTADRGDLDRFEQEKREFFENVRSMYLERATKFKEQYRVINAGVELPAVQEQLRKVLDEILASNGYGESGVNH